MNGQTVEELKQMLDDFPDEDIPSDVTRRLLAIMILTNTSSINNQTKLIQENHQEVTNLFTDLNQRFSRHVEFETDFKEGVYKEIESLKESRRKNPTLMEWVVANKKKAILVASGIFLLSNIWFVSGIRFWVTYTIMNLLKFSPEFIQTVLDFLFA